MAKNPNRALSAAPKAEAAAAAPKAATKTASPAAPAVRTASKAKYVTVASKLPMNIEIQLCAKRTSRVTGQFGSTTEEVFVPTGDVFLIRGTAYPVMQPPKGFPKRPDMIEDDKGGYAVTSGIPADFMAEWMEQNKDTDMVRNGIIKVQPDVDSLIADAAEHADVDSGLGPMNTEVDGKGLPVDRRAPRPIGTSITAPKPEPRPGA